MNSGNRSGYILLEMMLALAIFVIAIAPAGRVLNDTLQVYLAVEDNQALHAALINHTNFLLASTLSEGTFESDAEDYPGVKISTTIEPYEPDIEASTEEGEFVEITNVFVIKVKAQSEENELESTFHLRQLN